MSPSCSVSAPMLASEPYTQERVVRQIEFNRATVELTTSLARSVVEDLDNLRP